MLIDKKKFNLNYKIIIEDNYNKNIILKSYNDLTDNETNNFEDNLNSFTIKCDIQRIISETNQRAKLTIYNLGEDTRKRIKKNFYTDNNIIKNFRNIEIYAGYESFVTLIFKGFIYTCLSYKNNTEMITELNCLSNGATAVAGHSNISLNPNYTDYEIIQQLAKTMTNIEIGYITKDTDNLFHKNKRGYSFDKNAFEILKDKNKKLDIFVDNQKLYIMNEKEVRTAETIEINNESGLMSIKEYEIYLEITMIFEPLANLNNKVVINSDVFKEYNGIYSIMGINHNLNISKIGNNSLGQTTLKLNMLNKKFIKEIKV